MSPRKEQELQEKRLFEVVRRATKRVQSTFSQPDPRLLSAITFGAIGISPKHLAVWWIFRDKAAVSLAAEKGLHDLIRQETLAMLAEEGFPAEFRPEIFIGFAPADE